MEPVDFTASQETLEFFVSKLGIKHEISDAKEQGKEGDGPPRRCDRL